MRTRTPKSVFLLEPSRCDLDAIVYVLNRKNAVLHSKRNPEVGSPVINFSEENAELRRLVNNWLASGPNLSDLLENDRDLAARCKHGKTELFPTDSGRAQLLWTPELENHRASSQRDNALIHFVNLIINPDCEKLAGPCARCDKYYLKKRRNQKRYCSRDCGAAMTALEATRKKRQEEYRTKIRRAKSAMERLPRRHRRKGWKELVSAETGISVHWLTRAVNQKKLVSLKFDS